MNLTNIYLYASSIGFLFLFGIWSKTGGANIFAKLVLLLMGVLGLVVAIKG